MKLYNIPKRQIFGIFGKKKTEVVLPKLVDSEQMLTIDRYRGRLDDFLQNTDQYERYLDEENGVEIENLYQQNDENTIIKGKCTQEGTERYKARGIERGIPRLNWRAPLL